MGHIIAVTDVGNTPALQCAKMLVQRLQGRQNLAGMEHIGEAIDHWDGRDLGQFFNSRMGKGADDNAIIITRQNTPEIFDGLTQAQDDLRVLKVTGMAPELRAQLQASTEAHIDKVRQLMQLKGIGINGAWFLVMEFFGWRAFKNRREVGGLAGFTPTPYHSGASAREQGITKSGNRHVRWMTTELAWSWLRFQPDSALSVWFRERFGNGGKRLRRIGIVAVARKLLIALWRFLETGVIPAGAVLKEV